MITVGQLLRSKENLGVFWAAPEDTVYKALELMAEQDIGGLPIMKEGKLVGFFSERDYARKVILKGKSSLKTPISEIMEPSTITVTPEHSVEDCMAIMTERHIRHLIVWEHDQLVGVVSIRDLVEAVVKAEEDRIASLENYIEGTDYNR